MLNPFSPDLPEVSKAQYMALTESPRFHPVANRHLLDIPIIFRGPYWEEFVRVLGAEQAEELAARVELVRV